MSDDDDDRRGSGSTLGEAIAVDPAREISELFEELEVLLKRGDVIDVLTTRGINASIALLAVDGLRAYLAGDKASAADDLGTAAEEIRGRMASTASGGPHNGHGGSA